MLGIESLKAVVKAAATMFKAYESAKADGKIDIADLPLLMGLIPSLTALAGCYQNVIPEAKDLTADEASQLAAYVMSEFAVADAHAALIIEKSLKCAVSVYELYGAITAPAAPAAPKA